MFTNGCALQWGMSVNGVNSGDGVSLSRRERQREATSQEIRDTARRQLAQTGAAALSLRAVAREMGLTAPALYRYFDDRDALLSALITDAYTSLTDRICAARDAQPPDDDVARMSAACLAYRDWGLAEPHQFALVFGAPVPGYAAPEQGPTQEAGARFGSTFLTLFAAVGGGTGTDLPIAEARDAGLDEALVTGAALCAVELPPGSVQLFLSCWGRLHGLISLELFGHLHWVPMPDPGALFRAEVVDISRRLGLAVDLATLESAARRTATAAAAPAASR